MLVPNINLATLGKKFNIDVSKGWYQYKRRTHKRRMPQTLDSTKVRRTNVGPVQTSDQYKRRTSTNVGLVQTSDWYKRRTSTNVKDFNLTSNLHQELCLAIVYLERLISISNLSTFKSEDQ